ncbi:MAG: OmpA family protein [Syntrophaceae bacterium]
MKRNLTLVITLCVSIVMLIACTNYKEPAEKNIQAAEAVINAIKAEAVKYDPEQVKSLESSLATAKDKFAKGDYEGAVIAAQSLVGKAKVLQAAPKAEGQARDIWAALGKFFSKKLPNGIELKIPELGVENKLISFIDDTKRPVDDKTWFSFDRLTFETGKATLKPESQEQLKNIAEILKAYPKVTLKIGGYTDNTGDPQVNLKLSQQRADTVMADLVRLGVNASRLKAEGYGKEHPVADNSTEEGRAKNRRIDMRVTSK